MATSQTWLRRISNQGLNPFFTFAELRYALPMIGFALTPTLLVIPVFQAISPIAIRRVCHTDPRLITGHNLSGLFDYYIVWVAHLLVSVGVSWGASRAAFRNISTDKRAILKRFRLAVFLSTMGLVLAGDALHLNVALLSHERLFSVLSQAQSTAFLFKETRFGPTWFSLLPFTGIAVAVWATITIVLCASKCLNDFQKKEEDLRAGEHITSLSDALESLRSYVLALSLVLVTSTLGTIAFCRIPLGFLDLKQRHDFQAITDSVGLIWGVMFSLILVALCVYPFIVLRTRFEILQKYARESKSKPLAMWLTENRPLLQVPANLQIVLSILSPATVAVLSHLVSS